MNEMSVQFQSLRIHIRPQIHEDMDVGVDEWNVQ